MIVAGFLLFLADLRLYISRFRSELQTGELATQARGGRVSRFPAHRALAELEGCEANADGGK
jgi:hypothetical protein